MAHYPPVRTAWQRVAEQLRNELLRQGWVPGRTLPSHKELRQTHGADYRTLRKALLSLAAEGVIEASGHRYRVVATAPARATGRVVLVAQGDRNRVLQFFSARSRSDLLTLSDMCGSRGISLKVVTLSTRDFARPFAARQDVKEACADRSALGYIVWSAGIFPDRIEPLLTVLAAAGKPVAVLDETGVSQRMVGTPEHVRFHVYGYGPSPGHAVARYLAGRGHHSVLYLSPYHDAEWSRTRLDALRLGFERMGLSNAVAAATDERPSPMQIEDSAVKQEDRMLESVLVRGEKHQLAGRRAAAEVLRRMRFTKVETLWNEAIRIRIEQLLSSAMKGRRFSAVVCANDATAVHCLDWLGRSGIPVPGSLSVVGFDDSVDALTYELTSYNFNGHAVMSSLVQHVLHPGNALHRGRRVVEIEGYVHERGTVRYAGEGTTK